MVLIICQMTFDSYMTFKPTTWQCFFAHKDLMTFSIVTFVRSTKNLKVIELKNKNNEIKRMRKEDLFHVDLKIIFLTKSETIIRTIYVNY